MSRSFLRSLFNEFQGQTYLVEDPLEYTKDIWIKAEQKLILKISKTL